ncbi:TPA: hypothetical protein ACGOSU_000083 [Streptococcus suis]
MLKHHRFYLNCLWLGLLFLIPLPAISLLFAQLILDGRSQVGVLYGLVAYVWFLVVIWLSSRPSWLDRLIGLPDMYIIHGITSLFALGLSHLHKWLLPSEDLPKFLGDIAFYLFLTLIAYSLIFMAGWLTSRWVWLVNLKRFLEKLFKHEFSIWIHRLNLLAVILVYLHIWVIDYIRQATGFMVLISLYTLFSLGSYAVFKLKKWQSGVLLSLEYLDDGLLKLDVKSQNLTRFKAGDFIFIRFPNQPDLAEPHPFSLACFDDYSFSLIIDQVGDFTQALARLDIGEGLEFTHGYGVLHRFKSSLLRQDKLVMIAGGVGIVPFLSLIEKNPRQTIHLIHTVKNGRAKIAYDWLQCLATKRPNFTYFAQEGRLDEPQLKELIPLDRDNFFLIAGPMAMNRAYQNYLVKNGIPEDRIFYESFAF